MTDRHQAAYDEAELLAIRLVREASAEWDAASDYSLSKLVSEHLLEFQKEHGADGAVTGVVVALSRLAHVFLMSDAVPRPAIPEMLDRVELGKLEQHQHEKDNPGEV